MLSPFESCPSIEAAQMALRGGHGGTRPGSLAVVRVARLIVGACFFAWWKHDRTGGAVQDETGPKGAGANQAAVAYVSLTVSGPPAQAQGRAITDGLVAAITLLNEIRAELVGKGVVNGQR